MDRITVLQRVADTLNARHYLEIGVAGGDSFFPLRIARKVGVDPMPRFNWRRRLRKCYSNSNNMFARCYHMTSDEYFARVAPSSSGFDLVFVDGLHTYAQALSDVLNAFKILRNGGVVVLHDCNPPHAAAAFPASSLEEARAGTGPDWTGEWCGDVWKAIVHLRASDLPLDVVVLDCDYGVGLVRQGRSGKQLTVDIAELPRWNYAEFSARRTELLNLRPPDYFGIWLTELQRLPGR